MADLTREQLRELMRGGSVREDGTRYTKPDSDRRREKSRRRNKSSKLARRKNR